MVRAFISLDLPQEILEEIEKIQKKIKEKNLIEGKFTEKENIHLTLKFIGEISEEKILEIKNALSKIDYRKFKVKLGNLGFFSNRILWVELLGEDIFNLQKEIDEKLKSKEERFMSHITIARIKKIINKSEIKNIKINYDKSSNEIKSFSLKKSTLSPVGPIYEEILKINLS
jgi:RNA 2',3'-cyclic 3'-phosphodiesterase